MSNKPDLLEVYTDNDGAQSAAKEWRESQRTKSVRIVKRTVSACGASSEVFVVCVWFSEASKVYGWNA